MFTTNHFFRDLTGKLVTRSKFDYPYSYDPYVMWLGDYNQTKSHIVYSDRLHQWDYEKFNECCLEVWANTGQSFNNRRPEEVEKFLSLYLNEKVKLTVMMEGCNVSNGYPYWVFYYEELGGE